MRKFKETAVVAHRGASAAAPENTLAAFSRALELGVDWIELDVRFTVDLEVAVIHDPTLRRTTGARGVVADATLAELQRLDAGSWFGRAFRDERIPSLEQVCLAVRPSRVGLLIEIKADAGLPSGFADILIGKLTRERMLQRSILQSFDHGALRELRRKSANLQLAALFDSRTPDAVSRALDLGAQAIAVRRRWVGRRLVAEAHDNRLLVFVWTVDGERSIRKMLALGIDGLITNRPERALRLRAEAPDD